MPHAGQLRKYRGHTLMQDRGRPARRLRVRPAELRAASEQQSSIRRDAEIVKKVFRIERHPASRQQGGPLRFGERLGRDDVAADRNEAALQGRRRAIGVAVGRHQHVPRLDLAAGRAHPPPIAVSVDAGHADAGDDGRAARDRGAGESLHEARGVEPAAPLVDQQPVIGVAADFRALIGARHQVHVVVEHPRQQRLLLEERVEMRGLERRTEMAGPLVVTGDGVLGDQRFEPDHRLRGDLEQLPRASLPNRSTSAAASTFIPVSTWPPLRELAPQPICSRSTTTTDAPARARWRAAESPV